METTNNTNGVETIITPTVEPNNNTNNTTDTTPNNSEDNSTNKTYKRTILRVTQNKTFGKNRYTFEVDGEEFDTFNDKGELIKSNTISKNIITLMKEIGSKIPPLAAASALSSVDTKSYINPKFVSLILSYATITFERQFKTKAEIQAGIKDEDVSKSVRGDSYVTIFKDITLNINEFSKTMAIAMLQDPENEKNPLIMKDNNEGGVQEVKNAWDNLFK